MKNISKFFILVVLIELLVSAIPLAARGKDVFIVAGTSFDNYNVSLFNDGRLGIYDTEEELYYIYKQTTDGWRLIEKGSTDGTIPTTIVRPAKPNSIVNHFNDPTKSIEYVYFSDGCIGIFNTCSKTYLIVAKEDNEYNDIYVKEFGKFVFWSLI